MGSYDPEEGERTIGEPRSRNYSVIVIKVPVQVLQTGIIL
jgi:hypothetical protein